MKLDIITIFPTMFTGPFEASIVKRAQAKGLVDIAVHDLRRWSRDVHHSVDDRPYGGGPGMVMMVEPIDRALKELTTKSPKQVTRIILTSAKGTTFTQSKAQEFKNYEHLIIIAGHYEGVDHRVAEYLVDEEISIGNYVLTGGELPALVIADAVVRLLPGVLGKEESLMEESHTTPGYLEYPHYTRPETYNGWDVPDVLLSGNHAEINKWRQEKSKKQ